MNHLERGNYRNLRVWKKSDELTKTIFALTKNFPREERFEITSQLRRSVLSVTLNIIEGYARRSKKELKNFLNIALGSLTETEYLLDLSHELNFISDHEQKKVQQTRNETGKLLWSFIKSIN